MKWEWEKRRNISSANITRTVRYLYAKGLATKKKPTSKVLSISFSLFSSHEDEEWRTKSAAKKSHDYTHTHTPNEKIKVEMQWKKVMAFINIRTVFSLSISLSRSLFLFIAFFLSIWKKVKQANEKAKLYSHDRITGAEHFFNDSIIYFSHRFFTLVIPLPCLFVNSFSIQIVYLVFKSTKLLTT